MKWWKENKRQQININKLKKKTTAKMTLSGDNLQIFHLLHIVPLCFPPFSNDLLSVSFQPSPIWFLLPKLESENK